MGSKCKYDIFNGSGRSYDVATLLPDMMCLVLTYIYIPEDVLREETRARTRAVLHRKGDGGKHSSHVWQVGGWMDVFRCSRVVSMLHTAPAAAAAATPI